MNDSNAESPGGRRWLAAAFVVAATYFYFLIFAEFALLALAREQDPEGGRLRGLMAVLGAGGVAGGLLAAWRYRSSEYARAVAAGLLAGGAAAMWAVVAGGWLQLLAATALAGVALGWLTVTLASGLRRAVGMRSLGRCVGLGTGLAYAGCNLPPVFTAPAATQAALAVAGTLLGALAALGLRFREPEKRSPPSMPSIAWVWIPVLLILVWFDSAAFYIIQQTPELRGATWEGDATLWGNAVVHLVAAIGAGAGVDRGWRGPLTGAAALLLAGACLGLGGATAGRWHVEWLYTAGVSLYSVVLVQVPASSGRPWMAATVFAVAGWLGSALGIGMAQDLRRVPPEFVAAALVLLGLALFVRTKRPSVLAALGALLVVVPVSLEAESPLVRRGRDVYVAEGCIHCHSQYIRPQTDDAVRWGPAVDLKQTLDARPPLLGNRRQGPDLSHVGNRRDETWNRLHLIAPRAVSPGSRMPSYAHLFEAGDGRGEALVAYLAALGAETREERREFAQNWSPAPGTKPAANGARQFAALCTPCHGPDGAGGGPLAGFLATPAGDLRRGAWRQVRGDNEVLALMRIVKFGLPGTAMAGHEYLRDEDVFALALHVRHLHAAGEKTPAP